MYVYLYVHAWVCVWVFTHVGMYLYVYVRAWIYECVYTYTGMHIWDIGSIRRNLENYGLINRGALFMSYHVSRHFMGFIDT